MSSFTLGSLGAIANKNDKATQWHNGKLLNFTLDPANFTAGSTLVIDDTYHVMGGIVSKGLHDVTIQLDGTLFFSDLVEEWPRNENGHVLECLQFRNAANLNIISSLGGGSPEKMGVLQGNGQEWWWWPFFGYLKHHEDRPRLLRIDRGTDIYIKHILLLDSPYWTTKLTGIDGLEIDGCGISARRTRLKGHNLVDLSAFNTDGFDISGHNVYVHDCNCYAQDDCFTVKDNYDGRSTNMLFENNNASGMAMVIGSIGGSHIHNITFRNFYVQNTFKGIYTKFRGGTGKMTNITFENIVMDSPEQFPIWIGPAQQADNPDPCYANPCSLCWPDDPAAVCFPIEESKMENITLRNIEINNPKMSLGVIMGSNDNPTKNFIFDNVVVNKCGVKPQASIEEAFPLLPMDIHDDYVLYSFLIVGAGVALALLIFCCIPIYCCVKRQCCKCWQNKRMLKTGACFAFLLAIFSPVIWWMSAIGEDKMDNGTFLECSGVSNAIATGKTTPVPHCFEDKTDVDQSEFDSFEFCEINKHWAPIIIAVASASTIGWCYRKARIEEATMRAVSEGSDDPRGSLMDQESAPHDEKL
ncbi:hypothetical protein TrVE_jg12714 [Triparma verrucosa]|uniref:Uncharacterized protein n=1 Tax=Triparma verrucosa TaxID=1606542 RepID=A0A9W7KT20_9STRA|nr:hypothetical protein TrVE_jg12714 [Triparma verrucosa]